MKVKYFSDTDTLYIIFNDHNVEETREMDENTIADYDHLGNIVSLTIEHAKTQTDLDEFSFQNVVSSVG